MLAVYVLLVLLGGDILGLGLVVLNMITRAVVGNDPQHVADIYKAVIPLFASCKTNPKRRSVLRILHPCLKVRCSIHTARRLSDKILTVLTLTRTLLSP